MSRLLIVAQQKGGSYKTFLTVHLKTFLDGKQLNFTPVDLDFEDDLVPRIFKSAITISPDPRDLADGVSHLPKFMLKMLGGTDNAIIDSGANTGNTWYTLLEQSCPNLRQDLQNKGVKVTIVVPIDGSKKAIHCFNAYKEIWPEATLIAAGIKQFPNQVLEMPEHDPKLTVHIPLPTRLLFDTYRRLAMPIDAIRDWKGSETGEDLSLQTSDAYFYLPALHKEFEKVLQHLIP